MEKRRKKRRKKWRKKCTLWGEIDEQDYRTNRKNQANKFKWESCDFCGAGVSKNSGVCSWWELVKEIADKIGENKCTSCEIKDLLCEEADL